jgi:hypothetical protein
MLLKHGWDIDTIRELAIFLDFVLGLNMTLHGKYVQQVKKIEESIFQYETSLNEGSCFQYKIMELENTHRSPTSRLCINTMLKPPLIVDQAEGFITH